MDEANEWGREEKERGIRWENRRRRRRERNDERQREMERYTSFDPLDVTNCLLPHARLSHRTKWGCHRRRRSSFIGIARSASSPPSGIPRARFFYASSVDRPPSRRTALFFIVGWITRGSGRRASNNTGGTIHARRVNAGPPFLPLFVGIRRSDRAIGEYAEYFLVALWISASRGGSLLSRGGLHYETRKKAIYRSVFGDLSIPKGSRLRAP